MTVIYRTGTVHDIPSIASFLYQAIVGVSQYLVEGLFEHVDVKEVLEVAIADRETNMCYKHALVAEVDGKIEGAATAYPSTSHVFPDLLYSYLDDEKIKVIMPLFCTLPADSIYIYSIACQPEQRQMNLFKGLTIRLFNLYRPAGYNAAYLHVFENNLKFLKFLKKQLEVVQTVSIPPQPKFNIPEKIYLLRYDATLRKSCWRKTS